MCLTIWVSYKTLQELDIAIVKATNHVERPAKEKHIRGGCSLSFSIGDGMHVMYEHDVSSLPLFNYVLVSWVIHK